LDIVNFKLKAGNETIQLTKKESDILALFATNQNTLLKREQILKSVWQNDSYYVGRSLDVFVSKLRKYLEPDTEIKIVNIHGYGYKLEVTT
jgi:DNA-binding response OmpR family regulator